MYGNSKSLETLNTAGLKDKIPDSIKPLTAETEQKTPKDKILQFFEQQSGFPQEEIEKRLGSEILEDLNLPLEDVLTKYFGDDTDEMSLLGIKTSMANYHKHSPENAIGYIWRDILALKLIGNGEEINPKDEKILECVSLNPLVLLQKVPETYAHNNWSYKSFLNETAIEHIKKTLKEGETVEDRINHTQERLERIRQIGLEIMKSGKIPVLRVLFMEDSQKEAFIKDHNNATEFSPRNPDIDLAGFTLSDVIAHTRYREENTPFDSWTYEAPNCDSLYCVNQLAEGKAVVLVSEVAKEEMVWAREFSAPFITKEVWRFYRDFDINATKIENAKEQKLQGLNGIKGVFSPTESEAVLWGKHPVKAIIDFGVNPL